MFKSKAKKAEEAAAAWDEQHHELTAVLDAARAGSGYECSHIVAKKGESEIAFIDGVGLIEMRAGAGHYSGHSQGVSIPIGSIGGRSVRYRVGAQKGHFVAGTPEEKVVDQGQLVITSQRLVFMGKSKTSECSFGKLLNIQQAPGRITVSVSNRQKPTVVQYGTKLDGWVEMRLGLALAIFRHESVQFADVIEQNLRELEAERPGMAIPQASLANPSESSPPPIETSPQSTSAVSVLGEQVNPPASQPQAVTPEPASQSAPAPPPPPSWSTDPTGRFELRWWDGTRWTENVSTAGQQSVDLL